ncbi:MAG: EFR1 family ferrodoxin [Defluviitaleaceae bacterium]|nr:EFR1 family ferrodoxin [Defluviitaleaceae bacterium]
MPHTTFYFTGTGNSLKVARDIASGLETPNIISIAENIDKATKLALQGAIGFVFPVYYCGLPQLVQEFISLTNLSEASYIYVVCTYGAMGGNGGCISQARKILKNKGKVLNAAFYVKCVDNFILWTWDVTPKEKHTALHEGAYKKSQEIAKIVLEKKRYRDRSITEYIGPILFGYGHFLKTVNFDDKSFNVSDDCISCELCANVCPTKNICLNDGQPVWKSEKCQRCLACLHLCPVACIQYGKVTAKRSRYKNPHISTKELI